MAYSLETLCGQAFGAARHHLLGVYKQRAMVVLSLVSLPAAAAEGWKRMYRERGRWGLGLVSGSIGLSRVAGRIDAVPAAYRIIFLFF